jgi:hypothetical protein
MSADVICLRKACKPRAPNITDLLPFVKVVQKGRRREMDYWAVKPTGDMVQDTKIGTGLRRRFSRLHRTHARRYQHPLHLGGSFADAEGPPHRLWVVADYGFSGSRSLRRHVWPFKRTRIKSDQWAKASPPACRRL